MISYPGINADRICHLSGSLIPLILFSWLLNN